MITTSLISSLLVLSIHAVPSDLDSLRHDYGAMRDSLEDYKVVLGERVNPGPLQPSTHALIGAGLLGALTTESRELSTTVILSQSASTLASLTQLGLGVWMPESDVKLGALKFSEFYAWGFQSVAHFFYGRQLIEAGLIHEDARTGQQLENRGELHQSLSWMTALWGLQSTFLRSWTHYAELNTELKRLDETPEVNEDYLKAKSAHARKLGERFRQLIVDDLQLRGTIEVALASAATAMVALKAPSDKATGYYAVTGLGLGAGLYKLISSWTLESFPMQTVRTRPSQVQTSLMPLPNGVLVSMTGRF